MSNPITLVLLAFCKYNILVIALILIGLQEGSGLLRLVCGAVNLDSSSAETHIEN